MKIITILVLALIGSFQSEAQINIQPIDSIVQHAVKNDLFEGTILIAEQGKPVYHKSFGFKDKGKVKPIENSTRFSIASITKMFTAIVILELVEERRIQLSDPVSALLPELKIPNAENITVHHLLLHISGLPNESDNFYKKRKAPIQFVSTTLSNSFHTIDEFNYANIDYVLLGLIIEKYDKTSWEKSVQRRILEKLKMDETGFLKKGIYPGNFAYTFSCNEDGKRLADPLLNIENYYAAGCMYSTAEDLIKLDQAMYTDELLTEKSKELMYTSYPKYNYSGYSVWTYNYPFAGSQPRVMERRGGILGATAVLIRMLDTNKTIVILSNNNQFNPDSFGNTLGLKEALMIEID